MADNGKEPGVVAEVGTTGGTGTPKARESVSGEKVNGIPVMTEEEVRRMVGQTAQVFFQGHLDDLERKFKDIRREAIAQALADEGFHAAAAKMRGRETKDFRAKLELVWTQKIQVRHVAIVVGAAGAVWLIYEGVAYLLRNKFPGMPSLLRSRPMAVVGADLGNVTPISVAM